MGYKSVQNLIQFPPLKVYKTWSSFHPQKCTKLDPVSTPKSVQNLIQFPPPKVYKTWSSFHP